MILRAVMDKVRKMFGMDPVVELSQPVTSPVVIKDLDEQRKYWTDQWVEHPGFNIIKPEKVELLDLTAQLKAMERWEQWRENSGKDAGLSETMEQLNISLAKVFPLIRKPKKIKPYAEWRKDHVYKPKKIKPYNFKLANRKRKSQKRNWKRKGRK